MSLIEMERKEPRMRAFLMKAGWPQEIPKRKDGKKGFEKEKDRESVGVPKRKRDISKKGLQNREFKRDRRGKHTVGSVGSLFMLRLQNSASRLQDKVD